MAFYNGNSYCDVESLSYLSDLSQDDANLLACGPQDLFFDKLDMLNQELNAFGISSIDVTNKWNWKPGSYDKIKEYMYKKLELNKKAMGVDRIMMRAQDNMNYMNYIQRRAREIELEKGNLKQLGVSRDTDVEAFKEKCVEFVNKLQQGCINAKKLTEDKVIIDPYIQINSRNQSNLYLDITLRNLILSVYDGAENPKLVQEIPMSDINIIFGISLRHIINDIKAQFNLNGKYRSGGLNLNHPYIASGRYNTERYGTVCLDSFYDDVVKSVKELDMVKLSMILMQWAQYYNFKISNPYNQPYMSHIGMPNSFSEEYKALCSSSTVADFCSNRLYNFGTNLKMDNFSKDKIMIDACDKVDCSLKDICERHVRAKERQETLNTEFGYMAQSLSYKIIEYLFDKYEDDDSSITYQINEITGGDLYPNSENDEFKDDCFKTLLWYYANFKGNDFCRYTYSFLEREGLIELKKEEDKTPSVTDMDEEQLKTIMKTWADSQGGV